MTAGRASDEPLSQHIAGVDVHTANPARVYDYWLGGAANFAVDRDKGDEMVQAEPATLIMARHNRDFLGRAVRYLVDAGVRQFLDLGSGIPTVGNVHEIAQQTDPSCRVAYVDNEPVAVHHSREFLAANPRATITEADLRDPDTVLRAPTVTNLLDFQQPIALLAVMVLHYFPDTEQVTRLLAKYRAALPPGSHLALSHVTCDDPGVDMAGIAARTQDTSHPAHPRDRQEVETLFEGTRPVPPGIVFADDWHPNHHGNDEHSGVYVGVGQLTHQP